MTALNNPTTNIIKASAMRRVAVLVVHFYNFDAASDSAVNNAPVLM